MGGCSGPCASAPAPPALRARVLLCRRARRGACCREPSLGPSRAPGAGRGAILQPFSMSSFTFLRATGAGTGTPAHGVSLGPNSCREQHRAAPGRGGGSGAPTISSRVKDCPQASARWCPPALPSRIPGTRCGGGSRASRSPQRPPALGEPAAAAAGCAMRQVLSTPQPLSTPHQAPDAAGSHESPRRGARSCTSPWTMPWPCSPPPPRCQAVTPTARCRS